MTVATGPSLQLLEQLQQHGARAGWLVLVGPLPAGEELAWIQAAAQAGVPVLAMVPGYEQGEELKQELQEQGAGAVTLCSELLAAESGEVCWYRYNDARHNGTTPPELLQAVWPNLRLESLELRPTRRLDGVLSVWLEQANADAKAPGLLWLPATEASAVLSGAGAFLVRLEAIWLEGSAHPDGLDAEMLALLEASCHRLTIDGAQHQMWQLDRQRLLERQVVLLTQEREVLQGQLIAQSAQTAEQSQQREVLQGRVEELQGQLNAQGAQTAEQSQQREVLQGRVQELEVQLSAQNAQTVEQSQQREVLQGRVQELEGQHAALGVERDQLLEARDALQNQAQEQQERFDRINIELDEILALIDQDRSNAQESREMNAENE